jgi:hypothetical protein
VEGAVARWFEADAPRVRGRRSRPAARAEFDRVDNTGLTRLGTKEQIPEPNYGIAA